MISIYFILHGIYITSDVIDNYTVDIYNGLIRSVVKTDSQTTQPIIKLFIQPKMVYISSHHTDTLLILVLSYACEKIRHGNVKLN